MNQDENSYHSWHRWSNYGQRIDGKGTKIMLVECLVCYKLKEVNAN
jgi:hypothetical protein